MPTTIDIENAKQIRESMEVYVSLDAVEYNQDMSMNSATGYSTKLLDASTIRDDYQMRLLADLQNNGFPLDDSHVLYDSTETASANNGKIGCRGNVGYNVGVYVSSTTIFDTVMFQGIENCTSATFNNHTYTPDANGDLIISVGSRKNATVVFSYSSASKRVQIRRIVIGLFLSFSNEDLLSVNLSLRSDLKPFDPTLPESEIEIRAYYPYDISRALSSIQDEKPISYQSGYDADLSEARKFYLSEPATWEKGVLTIKGIDSVHKLDGETFPMFIGNYSLASQQGDSIAVWGAFRMLYTMCEDQLHMAGLMNPCYDYLDAGYIETPPTLNEDGGVQAKYVRSIVERQTHRELIANLMNLCHFDLTGFNIDSFWLTYVDAGIPKLSWSKPQSKWDIYEEDCGDVKSLLEQKTVRVNYDSATVRHTGPTRVKVNGSGTAFKKSGTAIDYADYTVWPSLYANSSTGSSLYFAGGSYPSGLYLPCNNTADDDVEECNYGIGLCDSNVDKNLTIHNNKSASTWSKYWSTWFNWTSSNTNNWNYLVQHGDVDANSDSVSLETYGSAFIIEPKTNTYRIDGIGNEISLSKTKWIGQLSAGKVSTSGKTDLLPTEGIKQILKRSNETGSFTWKGDPRMQPRDVFTFHKLDGTTEDCTIESIELKHNKGGTTADITYRKGIV